MGARRHSRRATPLLRLATVLTVVALLLDVVPSVSADAVETTLPHNLSTGGQDANFPKVAVDRHGNSVAVWQRSDGSTNRIQLRARSASDVISPIQTLSAAGVEAFGPEVAFAQTGTAVVVWGQYDTNSHRRVMLRRRSASGVLGPIQRLSIAGDDATPTDVAVTPQGKAFVVWRWFDGSNSRIQLQTSTASGNLGTIKTLSAAGEDAFDAHVAIDSAGNAIVVWSRSDGSSSRIQVRERFANGTYGAVDTLSPAGHNAGEPRIAIDELDHAFIVWAQFDSSDERIKIRRRSAGGNLTAIQTLSATGGNAYSPQVVARDGTATVVWSRLVNSTVRVQLRQRDPGGTLGTVQTLSAAGGDADYPQIALDGLGNATVVWLRYDGEFQRVQARQRSDGGVLGDVHDLSVTGNDGANPQLSVDAAGNADVVWQRHDGANWRIQSDLLLNVNTISDSGQDATPPQVAFDGGGTATIVWSQFDGANDRVRLQRRSSDGTFLPVADTISAAGANAKEADVALDGSGNAIVVWSRFDGSNYRIQLRVRSPGGVFTSVDDLSAAGRDAHDPLVAIDGSGNAIVVWRRFDGSNYRIQIRQRTSAGSLSAVQTLSASGQDANEPDVIVNDAGAAFVVWTRSDGTDQIVQFRKRTAAGSLTAVADVSAGGADADHPQIALDSAGNPTVVYDRSDGSNERIKLSAWFDGGFGLADTLSPSGEDAVEPQIAFDAAGNAIVVWARFDGSDERVQLRRRSESGGYTATHDMSPAGEGASPPELAVDAAGNATVTWFWFDGTNWRSQLGRRSASGDFGSVLMLSAPGEDATTAAVAVDSHGNSLMAWLRSDGFNTLVETAVLPGG